MAGIGCTLLFGDIRLWHSITRCIPVHYILHLTLYSIPSISHYRWAGIYTHQNKHIDNRDHNGKHKQRRYHGVEEGRGKLGCKSFTPSICIFQLGPACSRYSPSRGTRSRERNTSTGLGGVVDAADIQTSIMAVQFEGGVVIGADSRTTTGSYIVSTCSSGLGLRLIYLFPCYRLISNTPLYHRDHPYFIPRPKRYTLQLSSRSSSSATLQLPSHPPYHSFHPQANRVTDKLTHIHDRIY
jgi:hypothetical protein